MLLSAAIISFLFFSRFLYADIGFNKAQIVAFSLGFSETISFSTSRVSNSTYFCKVGTLRCDNILSEDTRVLNFGFINSNTPQNMNISQNRISS